MRYSNRTYVIGTCFATIICRSRQFRGYSEISGVACHNSVRHRAGSRGRVCVPWSDTRSLYEGRCESCGCDQQSVLCTASLLTWFDPVRVLLWLFICPYKDCNRQYDILNGYAPCIQCSQRDCCLYRNIPDTGMDSCVAVCGRACRIHHTMYSVFSEISGGTYRKWV